VDGRTPEEQLLGTAFNNPQDDFNRSNKPPDYQYGQHLRQEIEVRKEKRYMKKIESFENEIVRNNSP